MTTINGEYDSKGSIWRMWDLHIHTPDTKLNDNYKTKSGGDKWEQFIDKVENSTVDVFGITDYFSAENYFRFVDLHRKKYPESKKRFFLNIELRLNETVNKELEEVNIHILFNPIFVDDANDFLSKLYLVETGPKGKKISVLELQTKKDFESATVTRGSIDDAFEATFGDKAIRQDHFLIITAANNDGIRPPSGKKRKEVITDEIDKFTDVFFGGNQNTEHFLKTDRLEAKSTFIKMKPVISGSDAHSFEELDSRLGKRETSDQGVKDVTWIKADKTYGGLLQILYDPIPGERVFISPIKPDVKEDYKIIEKILFNDPNFPDEIVFNSNLCSIIGSRSSGKSALLAYIAHSIDTELTESLVDGPGSGDDYDWDNIDMDYGVVWANGKDNDESEGKIVFVPQNHLFTKSKDPNDVKNKIEPVLFRHLPDFKTQYNKTIQQIDNTNLEISNDIDSWFSISETISALIDELKDLGDKDSINNELDKTDQEIINLKTKYKLSDQDIEKYQNISAELAKLQNRKGDIEYELDYLESLSDDEDLFSSISLYLTPSVDNLTTDLHDLISKYITSEGDKLLKSVNVKVTEYKETIKKEMDGIVDSLISTRRENKELIEKYQKNIELETLVNQRNSYNKIVSSILEIEQKIEKREKRKKDCEDDIKSLISHRYSQIEKIAGILDQTEQDHIEDITFKIEYGLDKIEEVRQILNINENTDFVSGHDVLIEKIRLNPGAFLDAIRNGKQKIKKYNNPKDVANHSLTLTETILFTAEMEGDSIGGFSDPTMTPGKRALFALRLILAESDDTWPLLIDQPEDDLDSRSIYNEVVPFLKEKKKSRQIIMVSHNANLVIGADSEQIIVANRDGTDRINEDEREFNYYSGSMEFSCPKDETCKDTLKSQGICEHACEILDGGKAAFEQRKNKYNF